MNKVLSQLLSFPRKLPLRVLPVLYSNVCTYIHLVRLTVEMVYWPVARMNQLQKVTNLSRLNSEQAKKVY